MPNLPWWTYALVAVELGLMALMLLPRWLSNQHGYRAALRYHRHEYREPNRAARLYDRIVYLPDHPKKSCLCYRCVPNKWKGDWSDAENRPGGNHRGSALAAGTPSPTAVNPSPGGSPTGAGTRVTVVGSQTYAYVHCGYCGGTFPITPGVPHTHVCVPTTMPGNPAWGPGTQVVITGSTQPPVLLSSMAGAVLPQLLAPDPPPTPWQTDLPRRRLVGVDYVIGFRAWLFSDHHLHGFNGTLWDGRPAWHYDGGNPYAPAHASCCPQSPLCAISGGRHGGVCGYHAYIRAEDFDRDQMFGRIAADLTGSPSITVHGLCKMWGIIVRHGDGYRSQYAAPVALLLNPMIDPDVMATAAEDLGVALIDPAPAVQRAVAREHGHLWGDPLPNASSGVDEPQGLD